MSQQVLSQHIQKLIKYHGGRSNPKTLNQNSMRPKGELKQQQYNKVDPPQTTMKHARVSQQKQQLSTSTLRNHGVNGKSDVQDITVIKRKNSNVNALRYRAKQISNSKVNSGSNKNMSFSEQRMKEYQMQFCKEQSYPNVEKAQNIARTIYKTNSESIIQGIKQKMLKHLLQSHFRRIYNIQPLKTQYEKVQTGKNSQKPLQNNNKKQESEIGKTSCSFCSKMITFEQLQAHHNACQMAFVCKICLDIYPLIVLEEHEKLCQAKQQKQKQEAAFFQQAQQEFMQKAYPNRQFEEEMQIGQNPEVDPRILRQYWRIQAQYRSYPIANQFQPHNYGYYREGSGNYEDQLYLQNYSQNSLKNQRVEGLKHSQIQNLVTDFYFRGANNDEDECSICTRQKEEGQIIVRLPCFHVFHKDCIVPWLQVKSVCPTCKHHLKSA